MLNRPENVAHANLMKARAVHNEEWPEPETGDLYRALVRGATQIAGSILGHTEPELAGEIATRTLLSLGSFSGRSSFSTWFYRIARNATVRWLENAHRRTETSLETSPDLAEAPRTIPTKYPRGLRESEKRLLDLVLEGFSHREIAQFTGKTRRRTLYEWTQLRKKLRCLMAS